MRTFLVFVIPIWVCSAFLTPKSTTRAPEHSSDGLQNLPASSEGSYGAEIVGNSKDGDHFETVNLSIFNLVRTLGAF